LPAEGIRGDIASKDSMKIVGRVIIDFNSRNGTYIVRDVVMETNDSWKYPYFENPEEISRKQLERELSFIRGKMDVSCLQEAYVPPMISTDNLYDILPHDDCYGYYPT